MKVLVIGQSGQLARALQKQGKHGSVVVAHGRADLDINDRGNLHRVVRALAPDVVVNTAAFTAVDAAEARIEDAHRTNALGAETVAQTCASFEVPLIHVSTDYVFSGQKREPYRESDPTGPYSIYGRTKLEGEERVAAATKRHLILRTAWVFSHEGGNFVRTMLRMASTRSSIAVVDDQMGSPTYAYDLAECIMSLALRSRSDSPGAWGVYHATNRGEATWYELAVETFALSAQYNGPTAEVTRIKTSDYPTRAPRPSNSRLSCEKLYAEFGISMRPWQTALRSCIEALAAAGFPAS